MTRSFRFALQAASTTDHEQLVRLARRAEQLGYAELYSADHVGSPDPFIPLVVAAEATTRLRVGPLVLANELHHPALLARTAATVDALSGGRLVLGVGTGYAADELDAIGVELRTPGRRVDRLEESLIVLRALLDEGAAHLDGEFVQVHLDSLGVRPAQAHVPILVGGNGRRVVHLAGRHADIFQYTGLRHGPRGEISVDGFRFDELLVRRRWLEEAAGERLDEIECSVLVQATHLGPGATQAAETFALQTGLPEEVVSETPFALIGSVPEVVDELERYRELLGVSHVVVRDAEGFAEVVAALAGR